MKVILGISALYHDAAACLLVDGKIVAAAQEERFTRIKNTEVFPNKAIEFCLHYAKIKLSEVDAFVFYDKPLGKFERILFSYYAFAPKGFKTFLMAMKSWTNDKLKLKKRIRESLLSIEEFDSSKLKILFSEHHLSHAASAYYCSGFDEAAILTVDGVGEWATASISIGKGNEIVTLKEMNFPHSLGLLYSAFTYFLGFKVNSGEYKMMGLAPYGIEQSEEVNRFKKLITSNLINIKEDGSIWLNQKWFSFIVGFKMIKTKKWEKLFGIKCRHASDELNQTHANIALAIQQITEECMLKMAEETKKLTGMNRLCLSGGVALNCVSNGKLLKSTIFDEIFVQPASGDAGGAVGAALAVHYMYDSNQKELIKQENICYLGPEYNTVEIDLFEKESGAISHQLEMKQMYEIVAREISEGKIIAWFQDRMEFGPRALGNRSILADARNPEMQKKINLKTKFREGFRPFAPIVLEEFCNEWFDLNQTSHYMLFTAPVQKTKRIKLVENFSSLSINQKLIETKSLIPAVTHADFSARIQTVSTSSNPKLYGLLSKFNELTSIPVLINTSFNVRGEPMVCTPLDAWSCFMQADIDILVIENRVYYKKEQKDWENREKWNRKMNPD